MVTMAPQTCPDDACMGSMRRMTSAPGKSVIVKFREKKLILDVYKNKKITKIMNIGISPKNAAGEAREKKRAMDACKRGSIHSNNE